ncbi:MAG TPA: Clp protease N-terminal domain-containing protein, partial [Thermoleophilaceae bacterium]|nr:Clp protease N-terminal domain-containing protein [Thermoleophilaceae bacterium]
MQADRLTVKAQEAIAAAEALARARANPEVVPPHLLLVLLEQEGGIVVPVLRRAGADPERVRRRANEALESVATISGDKGAAPSYSRGLIEVTRRADDEARRMGDEYVSTEHLLLSLAAEPNVDTGASREQIAEAVDAV